MKKILLPKIQGCPHQIKTFLGFNRILFLSVLLISFSGLAQGPGSPYVDAGEDVTLSCGEDCTDLSADFLDTGESTQYEVSSIDYNPPFPFTGGTPVSVYIDDRWSNIIPLPFEFCFYDEVYDEMLIGSNAVITFDLVNNSPNGSCSWVIEPYDAVPSPNLFLTSIFGPYMDVDPSVSGTGTINWYVDGEAPNRSMVINFPNIPYYRSSCNHLKLTSQVVLYETTNAIEIYVQDRPSGCSWQDGMAVMGIQNQTGTQGQTPPGRNTSDWSASNEAWRFMPSGESNVDFAWLDEDGEVISSDRTINVCPTEEVTTYTAKAIWYNCNGDEVTVTDDVTVSLFNDFEVDLGGDQELCDVSSYEITAEVTGVDPNDAEFLWNTGETTQSITVTESGTYTVEVTAENCTITKSVIILLSDTPVIDLGEDQELCDVANYEITAELIVGDPEEATFLWNTGETTQSITVNEAGTYTVEVAIAHCISTESVTIDFSDTPIFDLGEDRSTCFEEPEILDATPSNYPDPTILTYEWTLYGDIIADAIYPTLEVNEPGIYGVTVSYKHCFESDSIEITPANELDVSVIMEDYGSSSASDIEVCPDTAHTLRAITDEEGVSYQWYLNSDEIAGATDDTLEITIEAGTMGTQTYSVVISSEGCQGSDEIDVRIYPIGNCVISQGLTPNGDGYNDTLDLTFLNDRTGITKLQIFNRYGTLVYDQNNYVNQWFGQTNDGKDLPTGTYFYVIDLDGDDPVYERQTTGWIYLNQKAK